MLDHMHGKSAGLRSAGSMEGWGKTYDAIVGLITLGQEQKMRQAILELVNIQPGDRILEVGCGTGSLSLAAKIKAGPESQVYGIDIAPDMIDTARRKASKANLDIKFEVGRIETIPFPDRQFDLVFSSLMLHHVPDWRDKEKGIAEMLRVLIIGGKLLVIDFEPPKNPLIKGLVSIFFGHKMAGYNLREFIPMLEKAGFNNIETGPTKYKLLSHLSGKRPQSNSV